MRKLPFLLAALAIFAAGFTLWGYAGARLNLQVIAARELPENEFTVRFARLKEQHATHAVRGLVYEEDALGSAEDYKILEYTILARNAGLVEARMLEALVVPLKGDVLCYSQQEALGRDVNAPVNVRAGSRQEYKVYLLTLKGLPNSRDLQVSYYIWGNPFILKARYNQP